MVAKSSHIQPELGNTSGNQNEGSATSAPASDESEHDGPGPAPNQLLMEFVDSLMKQDYVTAEKLCQMILLYEPENATALQFKPLIEERLEMVKDGYFESSGDEDSSEDDSDEASSGESSDESNDEHSTETINANGDTSSKLKTVQNKNWLPSS